LPRDARVLQFASIAFDASVMEMCMAFGVGATLVMADEDERYAGEALVELMHREQVDCALLPPTVLSVLEPSRLPHLATVIAGGEACSAPLVDRWAPGRRFFNAYGPTEVTVWATVAPCTAGDADVAIGRPVRGAEVHVVDRRLKPVPFGVAGELLVGGRGVARGYRSRDDLTAERFVPDHLGPDSTGRLYRTGDLVRYRGDGSLVYVGRQDRQVKLRGFRIELGEIEACLEQQPEVADAAVVVREDSSGRRQLVGYLVAAEGSQLEPTAVRDAVARELPDYMLPAVLVTVDAFPLTTSGKIDVDRLPVPEAQTTPVSLDQAAQSPVERVLLESFEAALDRSGLGRQDNFFEQGGDSILALQVVNHARRLGVSVSPRLVFQHQTVAELAQVAEKHEGVEAESLPVTGDVSASAIQTRFFESRLADAHHYNQAVRLEFDESPEKGVLEAAAMAVLSQHDMLRVVYPAEQGDALRSGQTRTVEEIAPGTVVRWHGTVAERDLAEELDRAQAGLDLAAGPLFQLHVYDVGGDRPVQVLLVCHHLVVDVVSWTILLEDLSLAYDQARRGRSLVLPFKTASYQSWSARQAECALEFEDRLPAWEALLGETFSELPVDRPADENKADENQADENQVGTSVTLKGSLSAVETERLVQVEDGGRPAAEILLAGLVATLGRWSGKASIPIALEGHGREDELTGIDVTRTVGWFSSLYPVVFATPDTAPDTIDLAGIADTVAQTLRKVPDKGASFGILRYLGSADARERLRRVPTPQVVFNYVGQFRQQQSTGMPARLSTLPSGRLRSDAQTRDELFEVGARIWEGTLEVYWTYGAKCHEAATAERRLESYLNDLRGLIDASADALAGSAQDFADADLDESELDGLFAELDEADS
jgi:non-ribosomal peptide synthase protein (TIGR01720 family)